MKANKRLSNIPTNVITGFLGSGKTSAILHLLKNKPVDEKWAVLVNEFGEIGVDGSLLQGRHREEHGVFVREVPGGCMCCTAGLPMQIALNQLLTHAQPDRLLIEPTGLGHPIEVLGILSGEYYQESLSIHNIVTLVDARRLADKRYTDHEIFNQQIAIADIIVGNKSDLYQEADQKALQAYVSEQGAPHAQLLITQQGCLDLPLLQGATRFAKAARSHHHHHRTEQSASIANMPIPQSGYIRVDNQGEGFKSIGWKFAPHRVFNRDQLVSFLSGLNVERMKTACITDSGMFSYNLTTDGFSEIMLDQCAESRIEIIALDIDSTWEQQLLDCITSNE
ncbi:CobW family GTP-binding protein [Rhabdochromatium marinum]|uniref:CobW family GTP-binding protein n=1 Tax=Rhabdochromatium marinum TaxID=48729 RepID=UPI001903DF03|nr:GTP-binding protein [Rhabdochromatium marinum]MBK1649391.1 cobalamin biosynthesis protein CobW [Rhabdochromatium marinum]